MRIMRYRENAVIIKMNHDVKLNKLMGPGGENELDLAVLHSTIMAIRPCNKYTSSAAQGGGGSFRIGNL